MSQYLLVKWENSSDIFLTVGNFYSKLSFHLQVAWWGMMQIKHMERGLQGSSLFHLASSVSHTQWQEVPLQKIMRNSPRGILFNKTQSMFGFSLVEFVLSGCRGGVERVRWRRAFLRGRPWGPEAPEHVGKTISYSQMLSGHYGSYAWTPRGHTNTQLGKALGHWIWTTTRRNRLQGIFSCVSSVC